MRNQIKYIQCAVCNKKLDIREAHILHEPECEGLGTHDDLNCDCYLYAHPDCCPECKYNKEIE